MRARFPIYLLSLLSSAVVARSAPENISNPGIKTDFIPEAVLSTNELQQVLELAKRCGVSQVDKVYSFHIYPSSDWGYGVKSVDTVRGRRISFVTILVNDEKIGAPRRESQYVLTSVGRFWVGKYDVMTNILTTFAVSGCPPRIKLSESVSLATADRILEALSAKKIKYRDEAMKEDFKKLNLLQVTGLFSDEKKGVYSLSFSTSELSFVVVDFTLQSDGITVVGINWGAV